MKQVLSLLLLLLSAYLPSLQAQALNQKTVFADGCYGRFEDFRRLRPAPFPVPADKLPKHTNTDKNVLVFDAEVAKLLAERGTRLDTAWGVAVAGVPYIRVVDTLNFMAGELVFARLHVVGRLCYFYHRTMIMERLVMDVFNPMTQQKVAEKTVVNRRKGIAQYFFDVNGDGKMREFDAKNLEEAIKTDAELLSTWQALQRPIPQERLFNTLLIFNERNPVKE